MQHDYFQYKMFWYFEPTQGVEVVFKDRICACKVLYASFPLKPPVSEAWWEDFKKKFLFLWKLPSPGGHVFDGSIFF